MTELAIQPDSDRDAGDDFVELAVRHLSGELDQRQRDRLNTQLAERPERRDEFIEICLQARLISNIVRNGDDIEDDDEDDAIALSKGEDVTPAKLPPSPYIGFLGSAYHGVTGYLGDHEWRRASSAVRCSSSCCSRSWGASKYSRGGGRPTARSRKTIRS